MSSSPCCCRHQWSRTKLTTLKVSHMVRGILARQNIWGDPDICYEKGSGHEICRTARVLWVHCVPLVKRMILFFLITKFYKKRKKLEHLKSWRQGEPTEHSPFGAWWRRTLFVTYVRNRIHAKIPRTTCETEDCEECERGRNPIKKQFFAIGSRSLRVCICAT